MNIHGEVKLKKNTKIYGIELDHERDLILDDFARTLLSKYYLKEGEAIQEGFARASVASSDGDMELAQRIYDYVSKGYFMFSSPILSNAPAPGQKWKSLPISCFLTYTPDSLEGLIDHSSEIRWLSVKGGGVGGHWSDVRAVSDKSPGPIPFLKTIDSDMNAYRQGSTRKGSYAAYMDVSHPDIIEFINFRDPTGGDPNRKCFNLHNAVNLTDDFMQAVINGNTWDLKDPSSKEVRETVKARHIMQRLIETRFKTGEPYLNFIDTANKHLPKALKAVGLEIKGSNLCVHGDTQLLTVEGYKKIKDCAGTSQTIWNGKEWSEAWVDKTGEEQPLIKINFSNGMSMKTTPYHKFFNEKGIEVRAGDLKEGMKLCKFKSPSAIEGSGSWENAYSSGSNNRSSSRFVKIVSIDDSIPADTYCFNEPKENKGVLNGILTGNCNEIHLPTNEDRTAVCCLSSLNLERYDEWKDTSLVRDMIRMLDNVLQEFIDNAPDALSRATYSAERERSLGLGAMGFHAYLQKKGVPWESAIATGINHEIFQHISSEANAASVAIAEEKGTYPDANGLDDRRNSHLLAIAPNANSSIIACTSPSIEPRKSNAYTHRTRVGSHLVKNNHLEKIINERIPEGDRGAVWSSIITNAGSVQHLHFLDDYEKSVFKTAFEIDQQWVVQHASDRQQYICQGQSVNLFFPNGVDKAYVMKVHLQAWKQGLKGLYYLRTSSSVDPDKISHKMERASLKDYALSDEEECLACQG